MNLTDRAFRARPYHELVLIFHRDQPWLLIEPLYIVLHAPEFTRACLFHVHHCAHAAWVHGSTDMSQSESTSSQVIDDDKQEEA